MAVGIDPEEAQKLAPPQKEEKAPSVSISYVDLPPDAQAQLLQKIGIQADPEILVAEKMAEQDKGKQEFELKKQGQEHGQKMSEVSAEQQAQQAQQAEQKQPVK